MFENGAAIAAGDVLHTTVLHGGGLERHPDAELLVIHAGIIAVRFVLMPRRRRAVVGGFENRVLKPWLGSRAEELACDGERIHAKLRIAEFGCKFDGVQDLRKHRCHIRIITAREVKRSSLFPARTLSEEPVENSA